MPVFEIAQYELHTQRFRVEANDQAEAIQKLFAGKAQAVDNSLELMEVCSDYGMPLDEVPDFAEELRLRGIQLDDGRLPSIHSIEQVE